MARLVKRRGVSDYHSRMKRIRRLEYGGMIPRKNTGRNLPLAKDNREWRRQKYRIQGEPESKVTGRAFGSASDDQTFGGRPANPA